MGLNSKTRTLAGDIRLLSIAVLQVAAFGAGAQTLDRPTLDLPARASDTTGDSCGTSAVLRCQRNIGNEQVDAQTQERLHAGRTTPSSNPNDVDSVVVTAQRANPQDQAWQQFSDELDSAVTPNCATVGSSSGLLALPLMAVMALDGACR